MRELFINISNIDPFQYITIASVCHAIYRNEFLPTNTIGIVNETPTDNYSIKSIKWLKYVSLKNNFNIVHACNGGEQAIQIGGQRYKVDGYCKKSNSVFQFHGCFYHGCPKCYNGHEINEKTGIYMYILYQNTLRIENLIKSLGFNLITIWEHDFDNDREMKSTNLNTIDLVEPPKIRDSFFGGRCEPIKLLHNFKDNNQKGKYIDVVSLYPTVMYYDKYPVGHPTKIIKPQFYDPKWFGFIYCKILPPRGLYLPVLPYKQKAKQSHKLLFGLCRSCMQNIELKCTHHGNSKCHQECIAKSCNDCKSQRKLKKQTCNICYSIRNGDCLHKDNERSITSFWCTIEVKRP